jgi:MFS family permease
VKAHCGVCPGTRIVSVIEHIGRIVIIPRARQASWTSQTFRALEYREFRLYIFGLVVSQIGTYMQQVAEGWLVYRLTNSAFALGFVGFIILLPLAPLTLVAGAIADRFPRRNLLFLVQIGQVFPPLILAALTWSHQVQVWHVIVIDLVMSALTSIDQPVRQAFLADTVPVEGLNNAIAISATGYNVARVIGPMIAGIGVALFGEAICFAFNGLSFTAVAVALVAMHVSERVLSASRTSLKANLIDNVRYLAGERVILAAISMIIIVDLFIVPYQTLLPVMARDILKAGPLGLGFLVTASGVGAVVGSLSIASLPSGRRGLALVWLGFAASVATLGFAAMPNLLLACGLLVLVSGLVVALKVLAYTFAQARVHDDLRGRVMSVVTLSDAGAPRLGGLFAGSFASFWGAPFALQVGALACVLCTIGLNKLIPTLRQTR